MNELIIFLILGSITGFIAGLLGIGGGLILVPALLYLLDFHTDIMQQVITLSLISIIFTSISSIWNHHKHQAILWQKVKNITPLLIIGVIIGTTALQYLSFAFLKYFFISFEILIALSMLGVFSFNSLNFLFKNRQIFKVLIGFISTILGIGGGTLSTPFLLYQKVNIKNAIATSSVIGFIIAIGFTITFFLNYNTTNLINTNILTTVLLPIVIMSIIFAGIGARLTHKINNKLLKKIFAMFLLILALMMFIK